MTALRLVSLILALACTSACGPDTGVGPETALGPIVGHVDTTRAFVWFRSGSTGRCALEIRGLDGVTRTIEGVSEARHDQCLTWEVTGLRPDTSYRLRARDPAGAWSSVVTLSTTPSPEAPARVRLALGSCATLEHDPTWRGIAALKPNALVLLGDAPYVDTTDLDDVRELHRAFLAVPDLAALLRTTPLWTTWDDHDFGADNADGTLAGKANSRRAYLEYRAQAAYGEAGEGIYSRVRCGPVELFLLDVRWFMNLEKQPGTSGQRSCLGAQQTRWLEASLGASTAPFKLLVSGMVWHDKGGRSADDWASYAAERDALFRALGAARIPGCVLIAGDVHASQHAVFEGTGAGYPLHQLVTSPIHGRAWRGGDRQHRARRWGAVKPHTFLTIDADTTGARPRLTATWRHHDGTAMHEVRLTSAELGAVSSQAASAGDASRR